MSALVPKRGSGREWREKGKGEWGGKRRKRERGGEGGKRGRRKRMRRARCAWRELVHEKKRCWKKRFGTRLEA